MRPILDNSTGGHILLDLHSWRLITRQHLTVLPMPDQVIEMVHDKAKKEGMKPLKFHRKRTKVDLLPLGLPAGVAGEQGNEHYTNNIDNNMRGDYNTKPLQGAVFHDHRAFIMGHPPPTSSN